MSLGARGDRVAAQSIQPGVLRVFGRAELELSVSSGQDRIAFGSVRPLTYFPGKLTINPVGIARVASVALCFGIDNTADTRVGAAAGEGESENDLEHCLRSGTVISRLPWDLALASRRRAGPGVQPEQIPDIAGVQRLAFTRRPRAGSRPGSQCFAQLEF